MQLFAKRKDREEVDFKPYFAVNDPVRLDVRGRLYTSRVEDVSGDGLWIAAPIARSRDVRLGPGDSFKLVSSLRTGMMGYRVSVQERTEGPPAMLRITPVQALGKSQLRDFVRMPDMRPLKFRVLDAKAQRGLKIVETTTRNVSGGGLLILVKREDRPLAGEELEIDLELSALDTVRCRARVIRIDPIENVHDAFEMAVRFTSLNEQNRKKVIKQVYAREAELRKAGLL